MLFGTPTGNSRAKLSFEAVFSFFVLWGWGFLGGFRGFLKIDLDLPPPLDIDV